VSTHEQPSWFRRERERERERERSILRWRDVRGKRLKKKKQIMLLMGDEGEI
jgi:hypothetical protein